MKKERRTCDACGAPMVERRNRVRRNYFYGCSTYPRCKATQTHESGEHPDPYVDIDRWADLEAFV